MTLSLVDLERQYFCTSGPTWGVSGHCLLVVVVPRGSFASIDEPDPCQTVALPHLCSFLAVLHSVFH
nr:hypothetical protein [Candidatus Ichthyocystis hellenicum]